MDYFILEPNHLRYTSAFVAPIAERTPKGTVAIATDGEPIAFWSVYIRDEDGTVQCVADLPTYGAADGYALALRSLIDNTGE